MSGYNDASKMQLEPIATAPDHDDLVLLYRDYGDNSYDFWVGCRSRHGNYWVTGRSAEIVHPTHWCSLPALPHERSGLSGYKDGKV